MAISDIIDIQIAIASSVAAETNFGLPLIAAYHTHYVDRVRSYSDLDGMLSDGFTATEPAYLAAASMLTQNPTITEFKIGRRASAWTQVHRLTPTATTEDLVYEGVIGGEAWEYVVQAGDTIADICDGMVLAINALTGLFTATDGTTYVDVTATNAGDFFRMSGMNGELEVENRTTDPGLAADLAAIDLADSDWYGLILDSQSKAEIVVAADYVAPRVKILLADSIDTECKDPGSTTDVMYVLKNTDEPHASCWYHADSGEFLCAAIMAARFATTPGSATWAMTELDGITPDVLTSGERSAILGKNGNLYETCKGISFTQFGTMADGEYIDTIVGADWTKDIMESDGLTLLVNAGKVPFTDGGISAIQARILAILDRAVRAGVLAADPAPAVQVPRAKDVSAADKRNRILTGVTFTGTIAGAIHKTRVRGTFSI